MKEFIFKYWIQVIFAAMITGLVAAYRKLKRQNDCDKNDYLAIKNGMKSLLRAEIIKQYNHYEDVGEMPIYARESIHGIYASYKALGGNGAIEDIMKIACEWPTKKEGNL